MMRQPICGLFLLAGIVLPQSISSDDLRSLVEESGRLNGKITVVTFLSARCPISNAYGDRLEALYREYSAKGVRFLFVNSNSNESAGEIAENARAHRFTFAVQADPKSLAAGKMHAQATPETFVLDREGELEYHGAIDDSQNPARVKHQSLREALDALLAGKTPAVKETKAFGCTIKRPRHSS